MYVPGEQNYYEQNKYTGNSLMQNTQDYQQFYTDSNTQNGTNTQNFDYKKIQQLNNNIYTKNANNNEYASSKSNIRNPYYRDNTFYSQESNYGSNYQVDQLQNYSNAKYKDYFEGYHGDCDAQYYNQYEQNTKSEALQIDQNLQYNYHGDYSQGFEYNYPQDQYILNTHYEQNLPTLPHKNEGQRTSQKED